MRDPNQNPTPEEQEENGVREPRQQDGTNWEENQRIDEEGNELDASDIK